MRGHVGPGETLTLRKSMAPHRAVIVLERTVDNWKATKHPQPPVAFDWKPRVERTQDLDLLCFFTVAGISSTKCVVS